MTDGLYYCPDCHNAVFAAFHRELPNECAACGKSDNRPQYSIWKEAR